MKSVVYVTEKTVKQRGKKYLAGLFSHESNLFNNCVSKEASKKGYCPYWEQNQLLSL